MTKLHVVRPYAGEEMYIGLEPTWNGVGDNPIAVTDENYNRELTRGLNWHHDAASKEDLFKYVEEWIREYRPAATVTEDLAAWKRVSKVAPIIGTYPSLARMQLQGFEIATEWSERIWEDIQAMQTLYTKEAVTTEDGERLSVQDYINEQIAGVLEEIQTAIKVLMTGQKTLFPNVKSPKFKSVHYVRIRKYIDEQIEAMEALPKKTARTKEIVGILTVANEEVGALAKQLKKEQKRAYKPVDKKKLVKKLKYLLEDVEIGGRASIDPVELLGANIVWAYDVAKHTLGYYKSETDSSITVKGTTILGIKGSVKKILRKPEEQLDEFYALGKNKVKAWFDSIKAVEQPLNGRTNNNLLLLRAD